MKKHGIMIFSKILGWAMMILFFAVSCQDLNEELPIEESAAEIMSSNGDLIPGKYIVVLHDTKITYRKSARYEENQASMRKVATDISVKYKVLPEKITRVYTNVLSGFAIDLEEKELQLMRKDPSIKYIEQDAYAYSTFQKKTPPGKDPSDPTSPEGGTGTTIWGLDRIDQRSLPLDQKFSTTATGKGVTAYIMDSGILTDHQEFQGRASLGFDPTGLFLQDCNGHGTHVAGIVGGATTGVARDVKLVSVKVLGAYDPELPCANWGLYSQMIEGLDWIVSNVTGPSVINMSIGGGKNEAFNDALNNTYFSGFPIFVSAGNAANDAGLYSPASAEKVFTVGATFDNDRITHFSNFGNSVKIFAPGEYIRSAYIGSNSSYRHLSGTSMSAPYVAGVAALYLETNPNATPQAVYDFISETSTKNMVSLSGSINNHLLFSGLNTVGAGLIDPNRANNTFELVVTTQKQRGTTWNVMLNWSPMPSASVFDLYINGIIEMQVQNYQGFQYFESGKSLTPKTYKLCVPGTTNCTNTVTVNF